MDKLARIMVHRQFNQKEAEKAIARHDKNRAAYHDYFCKKPWGKANTYDLCVNMSKMGVDGTVDFLFNYVNAMMNK